MSSQNKIRWWPAFVIAILDILLLTWVWVVWDTFAAMRNLATFALAGISLLLLLLWFGFFSRAKPTLRLQVAGGVALLLLLFVISFRISEVSGDLLPSFSPRWQSVTGSGDAPREQEPRTAVVADTKVAVESPQFLGPRRTAVIDGVKLDDDWQNSPPLEIWRRAIGAGWSSFSVAEDRAVTQEQEGDSESVVCYDLLTGNVLWKHAYRARYSTVLAGTGPRATPTISGGAVYSLGGTGVLSCLDLQTGASNWSKDILSENSARSPDWGVSCSPLVLDSLVIVSAGGSPDRSLVAYKRSSGDFAWGAGDSRAAYASPLLATITGEPQVLIFNNQGVAAHDPASGRMLWQFPWPGQTEKVAQPIVLAGDRVLIASGYGIGCKLVQISKTADGQFHTQMVWKSRALKPKFTNPVCKDGYAYGLDDGILACMDLQNGKRKWKRGRYGHGQVLLVGEHLLITSERGELVLVAANPDEFKELAVLPMLDGKTWNVPTLVTPYLLARNSEEAVCLKMPLTSL